MSTDLFFPILKSPNWKMTRTPVWATQARTAVIGDRRRAPLQTDVIWKWTLKNGVLQSADTVADLQAIANLFDQCYGMLGTFSWTDPEGLDLVDENGATYAGQMWEVAFTADSLDFERFAYRLWQLGTVSFILVAPLNGGAAIPLIEGSANFGANSALYIQGDWSAGLWVNLPANAHGALLSMVDAGSTDPSAAAPYVLTVTGGPGTFGIEYVHDYGTTGGIVGHELLPFPSSIPANTWTYVGVSRDATAKTVTLYTSDGGTITTVGTLSYSNTPGIEAGLAELTIGGFFYGSFSNTPNNSLFYPAISNVASAYMWSGNLTSAQHLAAAQGTLASTGLVLDVGNLGATPPVSTTTTTGTLSSTLTGTTVVAGPSGPNTARYF